MSTATLTRSPLKDQFERGRQLAEAGELDEALGAYEAAFQLLTTTGTALDATRLMRNIANILHERGDIEAAQEQYHAALAIAEANDLRDEQAAILNGLAAIEQFSGDPDAAERLYRESKKIAV